MSDSVWPHRWQPTRLRRPWDSPDKNTGVGCHFLLQVICYSSSIDRPTSIPSSQVQAPQPIQGPIPPTSTMQQPWLSPATGPGGSSAHQYIPAAVIGPPHPFWGQPHTPVLHSSSHSPKTAQTHMQHMWGTLLEHLALAARQDCTSDPHNTSPKWGYCCKTGRKADIPNT